MDLSTAARYLDRHRSDVKRLRALITTTRARLPADMGVFGVLYPGAKPVLQAPAGFAWSQTYSFKEHPSELSWELYALPRNAYNLGRRPRHDDDADDLEDQVVDADSTTMRLLILHQAINRRLSDIEILEVWIADELAIMDAIVNMEQEVMRDAIIDQKEKDEQTQSGEAEQAVEQA